MTRSPNHFRTALAERALETFVAEAYCGSTTSQLAADDLRDAIADLIADLGHYVDRRFRRRTPFISLASRGLGMWSAERSCRRGEPHHNHEVGIVIHDGGAP